MIKIINKVGREQTYLNIMKAMNEKPTETIIFNGKKLNSFPLRSRRRQGCPVLPLIFNIG